jgi:hypothetical protein
VSHLTKTLSEMVADTINGRNPDANASARQSSFTQLLAQLVNEIEGGSSASHLTLSVDELLARLANAVSDDPDVSALTSSPGELLALIRNEQSGEADISPLTTPALELWEDALDASGLSGPTITILNVAGQSNGIGVTAVEAEDAISDERVLQWSETGGGAGDPTKDQMLLPFEYPLLFENEGGTGFGPYTRYIQNWLTTAGPNDRIIVLCSAVGGTGLVGGRWDPDSGSGDLYARMIDGTENVVAAAQAAYPNHRLRVVTMWQHGETDIDAPVTGATYRTELNKLITGYRATLSGLGVTDDAFILGGVVPEWLANYDAAGVTFEENQIQVTLDNPRCFWVGPILGGGGGATGSDPIHYDAEAQRALGELYWTRRNRALELTNAVPAKPANLTLVGETVEFEAVDCAVYAVETRAVGDSGAWTRVLFYEKYANDVGDLITYDIPGSGDRDVRVKAVSYAGDSDFDTVTYDAPEVPVNPATWDPTEAALRGYTLTDNDMTAVKGATASWKALRVTEGKASGKHYVELRCAIDGTSAFMQFGFANAGFDSASYLGSGATSIGVQPDGSVNNSAAFTVVNAPSLTPGNQVTGKIYGFHLDMDAGKAWLSNDNAFAASGDPATGANPWITFDPAVTGALFLAIGQFGGDAGSWTLKAAAADQTYAPDAGFTAWG